VEITNKGQNNLDNQDYCKLIQLRNYYYETNFKELDFEQEIIF